MTSSFDAYSRYLSSPSWRERRARILERDGNRCRLCDAGPDEARLEVHHRRYPKDLGTEPDEDLITLCASPCHTWAEEARRSRAYTRRATHEADRLSPFERITPSDAQRALSDPLNTWAKEIKRVSSKRKKVEADYAEMARLEYLGGLYTIRDRDALRPCIPGTLIEATILGAARTMKRGKQIQAGLVVPNDSILEYTGPTDVNVLSRSPDFILRNSVKVGHARVMRTRPMFRNWEATTVVHYHDTDLDHDTVVDMMRIAGEIIGIGDWRPRFGRFNSSVS